MSYLCLSLSSSKFPFQPEGCAGQTAPELKVDQQLLEIEGQTLHGLKHKDVVMAIKHAFEGELGKVIDFTILDPSN